MALEIEQTMVNGSVVRYHRIGEISIEIGGSVGEAVLHSYMVKEHRDLAYPFAFKRVYPFTHDGSPENMFRAAYAAIKALPEFSQAVDV